MLNQHDMPEILVFRDGEQIDRRDVPPAGLVIGSAPASDLVLDDQAVGQSHAVLLCQAGQWWIRSADGRHEIHVAGAKTYGRLLADGDRISIGPFELLFRTPTRVPPPGELEEASGRTRLFDASDSLDIRAPGPASLDIPGYRVLREIGRGGMGRVFEAIQISTRRTVALKVMLEGPFTNETTKRRFEREVHIVAALRHPNIAQIYDSGLHQGRYWFAMEYVDGRPLDAPDVASRFTTRERLAIMAAACDAVGHAHAKQIVHRDLKPSNILISSDNQPHVLDFGLAKVQGPLTDPDMMLSMGSELMGTPAYMSPEQTARDASKVDARTDVYALGVILYQLLTGQFPYDVKGRLDEVIHNIATTDPTRPSAISKDVDSEAEAIILKAIAKNPDERYANGKELADDLRRLLAGEPVLAKLASRSYVLSKTVAKNRRRLIYAGVLVAAVVVSILATRAWLLSPATKRPTNSVAAIDQPIPDPTPKPDQPMSADVKTPPEPPKPQPSPSVIPTTKPRPPEESTPAAAPAEPVQSTKPAVTPVAAPLAPTTQTSRPAAEPTEPGAPVAASAPAERLSAKDWMQRLATSVEQRDYLRARAALDRIKTRFADAPEVAASADRLDRSAEDIERGLGRGTIQQRDGYLLHTPQTPTAESQMAVQIAESLVAKDSGIGIVVVRVLLEDPSRGGRLRVTGNGVGFYGGQAVTKETDCGSGDMLFVGSAGQPPDKAGIRIEADGHCSPTIEVSPRPGESTRMGDIMVLKRVD
ncbi:MAG: protein kinase [Phycisphaerae bacterium]|nr:protein kinase [Phycisphaerae bacterium]